MYLQDALNVKGSILTYGDHSSVGLSISLNLIRPTSLPEGMVTDSRTWNTPTTFLSATAIIIEIFLACEGLIIQFPDAALMMPLPDARDLSIFTTSVSLGIIWIVINLPHRQVSALFYSNGSPGQRSLHHRLQTACQTDFGLFQELTYTP